MSAQKRELEHISQIDWYVIWYVTKKMSEWQERCCFHDLTGRSECEHHGGGSRLHTHLLKNVLEMFFYSD